MYKQICITYDWKGLAQKFSQYRPWNIMLLKMGRTEFWTEFSRSGNAGIDDQKYTKNQHIVFV